MKQVLSTDGKEVRNIWYLPHSIEVMNLFKTLDEDSCIEALTNMLRICSALHDLVHYIFAHVEMGNKRVNIFSGQNGSESSVDSGGVEGISKYYHFLHLSTLKICKTPPFKEYPRYDTKSYPVVRLLFWNSGKCGVTSLLYLFQDPLSSQVVVSFKVPSKDQNISVWKLFVLDKNTLNYIVVWKLFVLRIVTWSYNWLQMIMKGFIIIKLC